MVDAVVVTLLVSVDVGVVIGEVVAVVVGVTEPDVVPEELVTVVLGVVVGVVWSHSEKLPAAAASSASFSASRVALQPPPLSLTKPANVQLIPGSQSTASVKVIAAVAALAAAATVAHPVRWVWSSATPPTSELHATSGTSPASGFGLHAVSRALSPTALLTHSDDITL